MAAIQIDGSALTKGKRPSGIDQRWMQVRKEADLEAVRLHDLRNS